MREYTHTHTHTHTDNLKETKGITLIALVITIIILLILAGITISTLTGENGLLKKIEQAKEEHIKGEEKEQKDLDKLYSSIKVAENSQVTLTMEELNKYIEEKMKENLFTGTELIKEPIIVDSSTNYVKRNMNFTLENSIEDYEFLLITFGNASSNPNPISGKNSMLINVDGINYYEEGEDDYYLSAEAGADYSNGYVCFKDDRTICINATWASNGGRTKFGIESIKGIK